MINDKENGPSAQLRRLKIGESIIWPESKRKAVYVTAKAAGVSVKVRKVANGILITRISMFDKPRLECCSECGRRYFKRAGDDVVLEVEDI